LHWGQISEARPADAALKSGWLPVLFIVTTGLAGSRSSPGLSRDVFCSLPPEAQNFGSRALPGGLLSTTRTDAGRWHHDPALRSRLLILPRIPGGFTNSLLK